MDITLKPTSVRLNATAYQLVKEAARREHRSISNWLELMVFQTLGVKNKPNKETHDAYLEARRELDAINSGGMAAEPIDTSSVESMLKSCGV